MKQNRGLAIRVPHSKPRGEMGVWEQRMLKVTTGRVNQVTRRGAGAVLVDVACLVCSVAWLPCSRVRKVQPLKQGSGKLRQP